MGPRTSWRGIARRSWPRGLGTVALVIPGLLGAFASPASAGTCNVPGSHPSIQQAVLDIGCTTIDITATTYNESIEVARSLTISGPGGGGAVIEGLATVIGAGTQVAFNNLAVQNGCSPDGVRVDDGAELSGTNFAATSDTALPCPIVPFIFNDGFESGDTSAWSATAP